MTNPVDAVKEFLWNIALKKGVYSIVKVAISFITSVKATTIMSQAGVTIDPVALAGFLTTLLTGLLTVLQNWLKVKVGIKWL